ncbi:MAG: F0F1 ATP synthase subunit gamma [Streptosporangiaceae bacterium]
MAAKLREYRRRIRSVQATAKITRAQELIAASRIIRAQQRVHDGTPYAREITRVVSAAASYAADVDHPLTTENPEPRRAAILLVTSDRGFCGAYNANVLKEGEALASLVRDEGKEPEFFVVGRKGATYFRFRGRELAEEWTGFTDRPSYADARGIGQRLIDEFLRSADEGGVDEIHVVYTEFVSMLTQRATVRRLLPLEVEETTEEPVEGPIPLYEFEPEAEEVLNALLPKYVQSRLYHALLESAASEHAARRRAMKSATDNANELVDEFTRLANQARQAEITQEISEIVGGANALAEATAGSE